MPGRTIRKPAPPAAPAERDAVAECALELRRIGDKADLQQKVLNLITKLFCPKTWAAAPAVLRNRGEISALQIWNERFHLHWETEKALWLVFCYLEPLKDGCRYGISLGNVTSLLLCGCQVGKKRKAMSTVLRYTVGGEWGRLELVLLRYGEPFENSASHVAFASHIPPRNCGQKVPKHRKN